MVPPFFWRGKRRKEKERKGKKRKEKERKGKKRKEKEREERKKERKKGRKEEKEKRTEEEVKVKVGLVECEVIRTYVFILQNHLGLHHI